MGTGHRINHGLNVRYHVVAVEFKLAEGSVVIPLLKMVDWIAWAKVWKIGHAGNYSSSVIIIFNQ